MLFKDGEKIKVIFLDVDGVLNNVANITECGENGHTYTAMQGLCKENVEQLGRIVKETGAFLVFSSTWRGSWSLYHFEILLSAFDPLTDFKFVGKTPRLDSRIRGEEILKWIEIAEENFSDDKVRNGLKTHFIRPSMFSGVKENLQLLIEDFIILDDDTDMDGVEDKFIHIDGQVGLTKKDADEAIRRLNGEKIA